MNCPRLTHRFAVFFSVLSILFLSQAAFPQSAANSGTIEGTVTDTTGAVIPGAQVTVENPVSRLSRSAVTDATGKYQITNLPFNHYHLVISAQGFESTSHDVDLASTVKVHLADSLKIGAGVTTVEVTGEDLLEDSPTFHTDVDRKQIQKLPLESQSSGLSSLVTLASPGIAADSNGLFHGMGDHASNSFSIDGQSETDQVSKVFSNQLPVSSVASIEVIDGAPPAEYGDKTSVVIVATTRSGQGMTTPSGQAYSSYGSFGSSTGGFDIGYGKQNWGNFLSTDLLNTGRFLDGPEFGVIHSKGNEQNVFDRLDYTLNAKDSFRLNLNYSRSWFQTPNAYENLGVQNDVPGTGDTANPVLENVGNTDQRSKIGTFNISPSYTHILSDYAVFNFSAWVRKDLYNYYPSNNALADLGPANLQTSSISQIRTLMNTAAKADYTYARGIQNIDIGVEYGQTFLRESDALGIVDNIYNSPCADASGTPVPGYSSPSDCANAGLIPNGSYRSVLAPYDLTRSGTSYFYFGHTDVKELALWVEDRIHKGNWSADLGLREDVYNGLTDANQTEPRLGTSYQIKKTNSVLGISYARTLETPFNENLVLSSQGCLNSVLSPLLSCQPGVSGNMQPGFRNEFHANLQQAFSKYLVISGEYVWKYTHNAFDFSVLGNTPITFPIDWHNSKIPGFALRAEVPTTHGFNAYVVMSSVAARFFPPQVAGAGATSGAAVGYPFRIDHDERYNETTHLEYTVPGSGWFRGTWAGFNWRYDSGLVAGSSPCYNLLSNDPNSACANSSYGPDGNPAELNGAPAVSLVDNGISAATNPVTGLPVALPLTADEEYESGLSCEGDRATPTHLIGTPVTADGTTYYECPASQLTSSLLSIPAPGKGDNDKDPPRVAPRSLFDVSFGNDNLLHTKRYKLGTTFTAINITNKFALYNFLSTFSGTHFVTPRALTAEIFLHF